MSWPKTTLSTTQLVKYGYRVTSRKFGGLARIDRPDWVEITAKATLRTPEDITKDPRTWEDYYRRCLSKDKVTVSTYTARKIPNSGDSITGYLELSPKGDTCA